MASNIMTISAENRGPWIIIVTWILGVIACLASFIKVLSKRVLSQKTQFDDLHIVAATVYLPFRLASYLELEQLTAPTAFGNWL